jgi:hypothetical protein
MVSSGIRLGSWDGLKWKHISPTFNLKSEVIAAKWFFTLATRKNIFALLLPKLTFSKRWMDFRASYGEKINGESWIMRDLWQTIVYTDGISFGGFVIKYYLSL